MKDHWKNDLQEYADLYSALHRRVWNDLDGMTITEIQNLVISAQQASQTNCGWDTYGVAQIILVEAPNYIEQKTSDARQFDQAFTSEHSEYKVGANGATPVIPA